MLQIVNIPLNYKRLSKFSIPFLIFTIILDLAMRHTSSNGETKMQDLILKVDECANSEVVEIATRSVMVGWIVATLAITILQLV